MSVKCGLCPTKQPTNIYSVAADFGDNRQEKKEQHNQRASGAGVTWCSDVLCSIDECSSSSASRRDGA